MMIVGAEKHIFVFKDGPVSSALFICAHTADSFMPAYGSFLAYGRGR